MDEKIRVVIVEDQLIFRSGLKLVLNEINEVELIGECVNGLEFLDFINKKMPNIVLMDINMPLMNGFDASKIATEKYPEIKILILSTFGEEESLVKMLELGIKGFLLKNVDEEELRKAILLVSKGKTYFSNELLPSITNSFMKNRSSEKEKDEVISKLTKRELEILQLITQGYTNKEIAEVCFISARTAGGHRSSLLGKTACKNTADLVSFAIINNLIKL